jgi:hypothetical protein
MSAILQETALAGELRQILADGLVRSVYQPIVNLDTTEVVGYEALARGPVGSALERPDRLFATAHACGLLTELEWACRAAAVRGALDAKLRKTLFVNVDPSLPAPLAPLRRVVPAPLSPYKAVAARLRPRRGTKHLLLAISKHLEAQVAAQGDAAVVLATFQDARHFTPRSAARYERLASQAALVGALGVGLSAEPAPGVRGAALDAADSLAGEWNVVVIAPHFAAAFVARDLGDDPADDMARRFDFCLTYDRELVVRAAETLMARVAAI